MNRQQLSLAIKERREAKDDAGALKLWMSFGGQCEMDFKTFTMIDPRREIEEEEAREKYQIARRLERTGRSMPRREERRSV